MIPLKTHLEKLEKEFDDMFKCDCLLCEEKGHKFTTTHSFMKHYVFSKQLHTLELLREDYVGMKKVYMKDEGFIGLTSIEIGHNSALDQAITIIDDAMLIIKKNI